MKNSLWLLGFIVYYLLLGPFISREKKQAHRPFGLNGSRLRKIREAPVAIV
jgi:hypothetical protein